MSGQLGLSKQARDPSRLSTTPSYDMVYKDAMLLTAAHVDQCPRQLGPAGGAGGCRAEGSHVDERRSLEASHVFPQPATASSFARMTPRSETTLRPHQLLLYNVVLYGSPPSSLSSSVSSSVTMRLVARDAG